MPSTRSKCRVGVRTGGITCMMDALITWNVAGGFAPWMLCSANFASAHKAGILYILVYCIAQGCGISHESMDTARTKAEVFVGCNFLVQHRFEGVPTYPHTT
ncbi:unnamed protein product [Prorocentrum cordatum]|uniref:Uncharacterized protein n=1 Tax=Prorocentrum cordatum TaxID=2364126 RepID=A0ABN9X2C5_9DINO|nr:unnamed protein product [Polarella glacialis]